MPGLLQLQNGLIKRKNKIMGNPIYHPGIINCSEWNCLLPMKYEFKPYEKAPELLINFVLTVGEKTFLLSSLNF